MSTETKTHEKSSHVPFPRLNVLVSQDETEPRFRPDSARGFSSLARRQGQLKSYLRILVWTSSRGRLLSIPGLLWLIRYAHFLSFHLTPLLSLFLYPSLSLYPYFSIYLSLFLSPSIPFFSLSCFLSIPLSVFLSPSLFLSLFNTQRLHLPRSVLESVFTFALFLPGLVQRRVPRQPCSSGSLLQGPTPDLHSTGEAPAHPVTRDMAAAVSPSASPSGIQTSGHPRHPRIKILLFGSLSGSASAITANLPTVTPASFLVHGARPLFFVLFLTLA